MRILYIYPAEKRVSFHGVAKTYIRLLREAGAEVTGETELRLRSGVLDASRYDAVFVHPLIYNLPYLHHVRGAPVVGIDVGETLPATGRWHEILGMVRAWHAKGVLRVVLLPSKWSLRVWKRFGIGFAVLWRHYFPPDWEPGRRYTSRHPCVAIARRARREGRYVVKIDLPHSWMRKGGIEYAETMEILRRDGYIPGRVKFLLKRLEIDDPITGFLWTFDVIDCKGRMRLSDYIALIDACSACLHLARAGGFELVPLECIVRGVPTIVSVCGYASEYTVYATMHAGCSASYCAYSDAWDGLCHRADPLDAALKLEMLVDDYEYYRGLAEKRAREAWETYGWEAGIRDTKRLLELLEDTLHR